MRKLISLILIFSIAGHASVCNVYTIKNKVFDKAHEFRRVTFPYYKGVMKHEFSGIPFEELISDYISKGVQEGVLKKSEVDTLFNKIRNSRHVSEKVLENDLINKIQKSVSIYDSGFDHFRESVRQNLITKKYTTEIRKEIEKNVSDLQKLKHFDALIVSNLFNNTNFNTTNEVDIFFNLILVSDTFKTNTRRFYLENFNEIFDAIKARDPSTLSGKKHDLYKRYRDIEDKSLSYRRARQKFHDDAVRANEEYRTYRRIKTMCRTRYLNTLGNQHKKLFKRFSYFATGAATFYGYYSTGKIFEEKGKEKFVLELVLSLLSMWVGAEATAADGISNTAKFLIWYLKGFGYNYVDKSSYAYAFEDSTTKTLEFEEEQLQVVLEALTKNQEVSKIFRRIDNSTDSEEEIQKILKENGFMNDQTEISPEVLEVVFQGISEHVNQGSEASHRLDFNNLFTSGWNIVAFFNFLFIYKTFCSGFRAGPHVIGGVTKSIQALTVAIGTMILYRIIWSKLYFPNREDYICNRIKC